MKIEILGTGCVKCKKTFQVVSDYVTKHNLPYEVVKVEDLDEILKYGILMTPGLVVDGQLVMRGKVPKEKDLAQLLQSKE
ncbi:MAG TPA: thioredoxin family protein [bacterium]|nr:thioredoxin family protein [bacterium]